MGFGARFQAVHVEDGWQDGGRSHTSMGGMASCSHSITAAPSPSSCCLSPFARFFIIFDHIRGEKKAERLRHRGAAGRSCIARTARLSSGSAPCFFFFYPASGFGCLNCSRLVLMQRNLLGAFAFLHGWVAVPKLRALHERGLQGHLGSLLSSKELLGTGAGMLLGALKSSRRRKSKI